MDGSADLFEPVLVGETETALPCQKEETHFNIYYGNKQISHKKKIKKKLLALNFSPL